MTREIDANFRSNFLAKVLREKMVVFWLNACNPDLMVLAGELLLRNSCATC